MAEPKDPWVHYHYNRQNMRLRDSLELRYGINLNFAHGIEPPPQEIFVFSQAAIKEALVLSAPAMSPSPITEPLSISNQVNPQLSTE
jgi:hypothetical protein